MRSDGIGVELPQIDTFYSQKLPFHSIIIRVKIVVYSVFLNNLQFAKTVFILTSIDLKAEQDS